MANRYPDVDPRPLNRVSGEEKLSIIAHNLVKVHELRVSADNESDPFHEINKKVVESFDQWHPHTLHKLATLQYTEEEFNLYVSLNGVYSSLLGITLGIRLCTPVRQQNQN